MKFSTAFPDIARREAAGAELGRSDTAPADPRLVGPEKLVSRIRDCLPLPHGDGGKIRLWDDPLDRTLYVFDQVPVVTVLWRDKQPANWIVEKLHGRWTARLETT